MERPLRVQLALLNIVLLCLADRFIVLPLERLANAARRMHAYARLLERKTRPASVRFDENAGRFSSF